MYRQSISIVDIPDIFGKSIPIAAFPTSLIGNPSWIRTDGYPPHTAGMTEGGRDPCHQHADMIVYT